MQKTKRTTEQLLQDEKACYLAQEYCTANRAFIELQDEFYALFRPSPAMGILISKLLALYHEWQAEAKAIEEYGLSYEEILEIEKNCQ